MPRESSDAYRGWDKGLRLRRAVLGEEAQQPYENGEDHGAHEKTDEPEDLGAADDSDQNHHGMNLRMKRDQTGSDHIVNEIGERRVGKECRL